jgi:PIN domain nuclease of toxin-antitoxin system
VGAVRRNRVVIVLDTHVWHWWVNQIEGKLSASTIALIERGERVAVSAISVYEMAWLVKHRRIELPMAFDDWIALVRKQSGIEEIAITGDIAARAVYLPDHHKDPHDRLIIATAIARNATLLTRDGAFAQYEALNELLVTV